MYWTDVAGPLPQAFLRLERLKEVATLRTPICIPGTAAFARWLEDIRISEFETYCNRMDVAVLTGLYRTTGGENWHRSGGWGAGVVLETWHGVRADSLGRAVALDLSGNGLAGRLPGSLGQLTRLTELRIGGNALTGTLPLALAKLPLREFRYADTELCVPDDERFRDWLGGLASHDGPGLQCSLSYREILETFYYATDGPNWKRSDNWLTNEPLDAWYGVDADTTGVVWGLNLHENGLAGEIPAELGRFSALQVLDLRDNRLRGSIPSDLGGLASLLRLWLHGNRLEGEIPPELGSLVSLTWLDLSANRLSGALPGELGDLAKLSVLKLTDNPELAGSIPLSLGRLGSVGVFLAGGTDLCAPADSAFIAWLEGRPERRLARCVEAGEAESAAYLTQAIQSRTHPVPLIADDPTLLRVFVAAPGAGGETIPAVRARFYHGGEEVHRVDIAAGTAEIPSAVDESSLDLSSNQEVPGWVIQPGLEMVVEIDPEGTLDPGLGVPKRIPAEGRSRIDVLMMPLLDLTVVPMLWSVVPDSSILDITEGLSPDHELLALVGSLLPVGEFKVALHDPVVTESRSTLDLLAETEMIRRLEGATGYYKGTMAEPSVSVGVAYSHIPVSFSAPQPETYVHELGHNMSLRHAPCGGADGADPAFPHAGGASGAWGYDFDRRELVHPDVPDLMGYCEPNWISDYFFTHAAQFRRYYERASAGTAGARTRTLLLWGGIEPDGAPFLEPAFVVDAPVSGPLLGDAYELTGTAGDGRVLFSTRFEMPEVAHGEGGSRFAFTLPVEPEWSDGLAKVTLSGPGGTATLDGDTDASMAIVRDRSSGQVRGILRGSLTDDLAHASAARLLADPDVEVLVSRGLPGREGWRR